ncbi:MAG TPA: hypothetical protein VE673_19215 [Pseudonocardiaceae bacterium]|nr:hypothetical protein [Pseudonocardiaceae bacterium]
MPFIAETSGHLAIRAQAVEHSAKTCRGFANSPAVTPTAAAPNAYPPWLAHLLILNEFGMREPAVRWC